MWDALGDLIPFAQFEKRRNVTFSEGADFSLQRY